MPSAAVPVEVPRRASTFVPVLVEAVGPRPATPVPAPISLAVPIPAGLLLVATSAFASQGYFNITIVIAVVIIANVMGDTLCYFVARYYGRKWLSGIGFRRLLNSKAFESIEVRFRKHPGLIIFVSRFEAFATLSVNLLSGLSDLPYLRFALYEGIGAIVDASGVPVTKSGIPPMPFLTFDKVDEHYKERRTEFYTQCIRRGLFVQPYHHWYICYRHTEADLQRALDVVEESLAFVAQQFPYKA